MVTQDEQQGQPGRPESLTTQQKGLLRSEHKKFIQRWADKWKVSHMTIRRALTNKGHEE